MAKFRYIGEKPRGDCLGYEFTRMIGTEVTNEVHIKKLSGNSHFQRMDSTGKPGRPRAAATVDQTTTEEKGEAGSDGDEGANQVAGAE